MYCTCSWFELYCQPSACSLAASMAVVYHVFGRPLREYVSCSRMRLSSSSTAIAVSI
jgi:hypothetical protein